MLNFEALTRYDIKHLTAEEQKTLTALFDTYRSRVKLARKSFIACPRCHEALTGRPFRPARKGTISTYTPCDICGHAHYSIANLNTPKLPNRYMRYSCTLAEARLTVREKAPELFL